MTETEFLLWARGPAGGDHRQSHGRKTPGAGGPDRHTEEEIGFSIPVDGVGAEYMCTL